MCGKYTKSIPTMARTIFVALLEQKISLFLTTLYCQGDSSCFYTMNNFTLVEISRGGASLRGEREKGRETGNRDFSARASRFPNPPLPSLLAPATQAKMAPMSYPDPRPLFLFTTRGHEVRPRAILDAPEEREEGWVKLFANGHPRHFTCQRQESRQLCTLQYRQT